MEDVHGWVLRLAHDIASFALESIFKFFEIFAFESVVLEIFFPFLLKIGIGEMDFHGCGDRHFESKK